MLLPPAEGHGQNSALSVSWGEPEPHGIDLPQSHRKRQDWSVTSKEKETGLSSLLS